MAETTLEHANVTVSDPDETARRLSRLFGWRVRWTGASKDGGYTVHVGGERSYLALYRGKGAQSREAVSATGESQRTRGGLNHIAVTVDDLDSIRELAATEGFSPGSVQDYEPGRRFYFHDGDGIEFEVVSYA
ncbi:VOC family protein [Pikeienuella piscinae]|uniref:VOC family protein n=1 Tax=Pikeienuella piscinae TaxID=2748098 RepID=A0A7L5BTT2_9RHOB|nr:VOC family protein [Pikeienuella piscinae]QIE55550.1 VOC family protein [Pikeienuella piscinae]